MVARAEYVCMCYATWRMHLLIIARHSYNSYTFAHRTKRVYVALQISGCECLIHFGFPNNQPNRQSTKQTHGQWKYVTNSQLELDELTSTWFDKMRTNRSSSTQSKYNNWSKQWAEKQPIRQTQRRGIIRFVKQTNSRTEKRTTMWIMDMQAIWQTNKQQIKSIIRQITNPVHMHANSHNGCQTVNYSNRGA